MNTISNRTIRLGIVGCGGISHAHANGARKSAKGIQFTACCDIRTEAATAWAERYGCKSVYTDYEEMMRKEALDGVLLASWPNQHRQQIERCLDLGVRNILCEKALTLTGQEAVEIWKMTNVADAFLMEGFMYRHNRGIRKLEQILSSGELGPVDNVRACFHAYDAERELAADTTRDWRQRKECGGGIPYDFACYCVNACNHFASSLPTRVYFSGNLSEKYGTINRLHGLIEYSNGCIGIVESSKKTNFSQELQISCANGILNLPIAWNDKDTTITRRFSVGWANLFDDTFAIVAEDAYQLQLENFAGVLRGEVVPGMPLIQSVVNTFTIEAIVDSVLEKRMVPLEIPEDICVAWLAEQEKRS